MINLTSEQLAEVRKILAEHVPDLEVRVFGSRVDGSSKQNSDLDLVIISPTKLDWRVIERIRDSFSSSNLPFLVDVLDHNSLEKGVAEMVEDCSEVIQEPTV